MTRVAGSWRSLTGTLGSAGLAPVAILMTVAAVERFDDTAFSVLAPEIRHAFHLSDAGYVAIATLTSVLPLLLAVPTGYLGDRSNRVLLSRLGAFVWATTAVATGLAPVVWFLVVARLAGGTGQLVNEPIHAGLLADYYPPSGLGSAIATYRLGSSGIALVGAPLAGLFAAVVGWRATFVVLAVPTVVMVLVMARLREPARGASQALALPDEELPSMAEGFRRVRAIRTLRRTWTAAFLFGGAVIPFTNYLNLYLDEVFHFGATARGAITGGFGAAGLVGIVIGGLLAQRQLSTGSGDALPAVIAVMVLELATGVAAVALAPSPAVAVVAIMTVGIGYSGFVPAYQALVALVSPPRLRAQAFAWSLLWFGLGGVTIGTVIGAVGDAHGQRISLTLLALLVAAAAGTVATTRQFVARDLEQAVTSEQAATSDALIVVNDLDVSYDGVQVLFGVNLEVRAGEIVALLGTNGAGKSTLLRAVTGLVDPDGGAVFYAGRDITHSDAVVTSQLGIVMVPGGRGIFPSLTVAENLRVAGWLHRADRWSVEETTREVYATFPVLAARAGEAAGSLSGGEQQMLALAQVMITRPSVLVIDELSLGLAPVVVQLLLDVIRAIHARGTTVIVVEQSVTIALALASRAVFMEKGEVRFDGPATDLLDRPDLLRAVFLGGDRGRVASVTGVARVGDSAPSPNGHNPAPDVLAVRGLTKRYGGVSALSGVDLSLRRGEILGIIGPNGAGKTTLFEVIAGFARPDGGQIKLRGRDVTGWSARARAALGLGYSFQDARLFPSLTVREALAVACERVHTARAMLPAALHLPVIADAEKAVGDRVDAIIETLGLGAFADKFVGELSTGSRRIVDLGVQLAHAPEVLLLDEPSSGIAQRETERLGPLLCDVRDRLGASLLVIEHDMGLVTTLADRLVALDIGLVVASGTPDHVLRHERVVDAYLGTPVDSKPRRSPRRTRTAAVPAKSKR